MASVSDAPAAPPPVAGATSAAGPATVVVVPVLPGGTSRVARCGVGSDSAALAASGGLASRRGDTLAIALPTGGSVFRTNYNMDSPDSAAEYHYCGRLRIPSGVATFHVLDAHFYESGSVEIINASTGESTGLGEMPLFSPDGSRFAVAESGDYTCESMNHLDMWQLTATTPRLEWTIEASKCVGAARQWFARELEWRTPDSLSFRVTFTRNRGRGEADNPDPRQHWLVRGATGWTLDSALAVLPPSAP